MRAAPPLTSGSLLTINAGSSSLKVALYPVSGSERPRLAAHVERIDSGRPRMRIADADGGVLLDEPVSAPDHGHALLALTTWFSTHGFGDIRAVGHRVVHGGPDHGPPERITTALLADLRALLDLDPDHLPLCLDCIDQADRAYPGVAQVACFDTAFHRSMPWVARSYAIGARDPFLRRYGFHGLSCESIVAALARVAPEAADGRLIVAHLGNGASLTAIHHGLSVDTTMGFSPLGGLIMGTRSGDVDPAVVLYLMSKVTASDEVPRPAGAAGRVRTILNRESGLLALSRTSADMRDLLAREATDRRCAMAVEAFCYTARKFLGSLIAVLGGLDTLVFTGGIGEHAAPVRERICAGLRAFGIDVDAVANAAGAPIVSSTASAVAVRVMHADEDLVIAQHVRQLLFQGE